MEDRSEALPPHPAETEVRLPQVVVVSRRAADRLRTGHLWVYRTDVERLPEGLTGGQLVTVIAARTTIGTAIYSSTSQITLRMVSWAGDLSRQRYLEQVRERLQIGFALRAEFAPQSSENDACRLIFAEADALPGIVIDRYADLAVVQLLTQATAQADVRAVIADELAACAGLRLAVERPDPRIRELESLDLPPEEPIFRRDPEAVETTVFTVNGLRFHFDAGAGQKTGAFLDQRLNYAAAASYARGDALDICTYQGGFALHLARRCGRVTGVDASRSALEAADRNLALNPHLHGQVDWIEADAFDLLREFESAGRQYDTIVLDPPAFAKSKRAAEGALRGYKEMNLRAVKMLRPGGTLVTCSCSHHVSLEEFTSTVAAAAGDAGHSVQLLENRGAAPDHPAILTMPETGYLKCLICRVR